MSMSPTSYRAARQGAQFNFEPGQVLARKYEVLDRISARASGELYRLSEQATGIERTAKFFSPQVDPKNRIAGACALKMHRLRHCDIQVQYRTQETISVDGRDVTFLVSDFFQGEELPQFIARQPGGRRSVFEGLHLLHALAIGVDQVHRLGEAHGDLAPDNIVLRRRGLGFRVKLMDLKPGLQSRHEDFALDIQELLQIFHQIIGGSKTYVSLPAPVKALCNLRRKSANAPKLRHAGDLRLHLETLSWK